MARVNTSKHVHYSKYYTDETKEAVGKFFAKDLKAFGYKFEDKR
jgi:hypothetical protein